VPERIGKEKEEREQFCRRKGEFFSEKLTALRPVFCFLNNNS